jgi:hypothetical protein
MRGFLQRNYIRARSLDHLGDLFGAANPAFANVVGE